LNPDGFPSSLRRSEMLYVILAVVAVILVVVLIRVRGGRA
jgi:hypothetical protein